MTAIVGGARLKESFAEPRQVILADADATIFHYQHEMRTVIEAAVSVTAKLAPASPVTFRY